MFEPSDEDDPAGGAVDVWADATDEECDGAMAETAGHSQKDAEAAYSLTQALGGGQLVRASQVIRRQQRSDGGGVKAVANAPPAPPRTCRPCGVCKHTPQDSCHSLFHLFEVVQCVDLSIRACVWVFACRSVCVHVCVCVSRSVCFASVFYSHDVDWYEYVEADNADSDPLGPKCDTHGTVYERLTASGQYDGSGNEWKQFCNDFVIKPETKKNLKLQRNRNDLRYAHL